MNTKDEEKQDTGGQPELSSSELLDMSIKLLDCFSSEEGTVYQSSWRSYGITKRQEEFLVSEFDKRVESGGI